MPVATPIPSVMSPVQYMFPRQLGWVSKLVSKETVELPDLSCRPTQVVQAVMKTRELKGVAHPVDIFLS